jgi:hypothetical protein
VKHKGKIWKKPFCFLFLLLLHFQLQAQADSTAKDGFADTTGGYGFMYLSTTCYECSPKRLVYYKKFVLISGFYKVRDFYSGVATKSVDHFKNKFDSLGYFREKTTQIWKSPRLFSSFDEVREYRDDLIAKLKAENFMVVVFDDKIKPDMP